MATGIRSLDALRERCYVDPDTGCWHWRGAMSRSNGRDEPRLYLPDIARVTTLPRAAWHLSGKPLPRVKHLTVWRRCGCDTCGNPAHLKAGSRSDWGQWVAAQGHLRGRLERRLINRRIKVETGQTRITLELAEWIRDSHQNGREVAHALDVSPQVVSRVRTGRCWAPVAQAASVFSWRPA
ncbi:MAG: hypothetical protein RI988_3812 [Pseudomonadota bacterium]|jgi:hypothetical protein